MQLQRWTKCRFSYSKRGASSHTAGACQGCAAKEQQRALEEEREREEIEIAEIDGRSESKIRSRATRLAESEQRRFEVEQRRRAEEIAAQLRRQERKH